jgi:CheY-like chemotaxis protein
LRDEGYAVTAVDTALGTYALVRLLTPAVVVLDLELPYRSGVSLLPQLKADPQTAAIPVVVLTGAFGPFPPARQRLAAAIVPKAWDEDALRAAVRTARAAQAPKSEAIQAVGPTDQLPQDASSRPAQVLVVDDDPRLTALISTLIQDEGYTVAIAPDGAVALSLLAARHPDVPAVILLDMKMPGMDGWEFTRVYRQTPAPHAPLICLTAANAAREQCQAIGADGYLGKPFTLHALRALLERHAKRSA